MKIPPAQFSFAQRVRITWHEAERQPTEAVITGINYDHRRNKTIFYTVTEDDGGHIDYLTEDMISEI